MIIRKMQQNDIICAAHAMVNTFAQAPWNEKWGLNLAQQRVTDLLAGPLAAGYVAVDNGAIVTCLFGRYTTYLHGKEFFIDEFYVIPECQNKGYGTLMLEFLQKELKDNNVTSLTLNTEHNYPAEKFYCKNGFKRKESLIFMYKNIK